MARFKQEAVRLAEANGNKSQVARDLGIHATMICKWQRQLQSDGEKAFPGNGKPRDEEVVQLRKENKRLQQEVVCSENRVARLMRQHGIAAEKKRKFTRTTDSNHSLPVAPNRLNQCRAL